MPVVNRVAAMQEEVAGWRQDLHAHPELGFDVHRTAGVVADKLKAFGCDEVVTGIGKTGVVGIIKGRKATRVGSWACAPTWTPCRSRRRTDVPYRSKTPGKMHACGHDWHTSILLGAAKYLCETRNFDGTVCAVLPARRGRADGRRSDDRRRARSSASASRSSFGMHIWPGPRVGSFGIRPGPLLAAADRFTIEIARQGRARDGAAHQHRSRIVAGAHHHGAADDRSPQRGSARGGRGVARAWCARAMRSTSFPRRRCLRERFAR